MKNLYKIILLACFLCSGIIQAQSLTFTVNPQTQCNSGNWGWASAGLTSTVSGATSYSWSVSSSNSNTWCVGSQTVSGGGTSANFQFQCPATTYTIFCTAYGGSTVLATSSATAAVNPSVTMSFTGNMSICSGQSATVSVIGAAGNTYTWNPGTLSGNTVVLSPMASTWYTVTGTSSLGCVNSAYFAVTVNTVASVSAWGSSVSCNGGATNLQAFGATTYTWMPGNLTGNFVYVYPQVNTCYTVTGANACGSSSAVKCVTVIPTTTVNVSISNTTVCPGTPVTFSASGANTYTWYTAGNPWPTTGPTLTVSPNYNQTVTLQASSANSCDSYSIFTLYTVSNTPVSISASPSKTICPGSSATLTAGGALSYTWFPSGTASTTVAVSPTATTVYTVGASHSSGCVTYSTVTIVMSSSVIGINTNTSLCAGQSRTMSVAAGTWTWTDGTSNIGTGNAIVVSPTVNTCYTVTGTNGFGCQVSGSTCLNIIQAPTVSVNGATSICANSQVQLTASGANYYQWSVNGSTATSVFVYPSSSTCYSVTGYNVWGCSGPPAVHCVTVLPATSYTNSAPSKTICKGSSVTLADFFSSAGYSVYAWGQGMVANGTGTTVAMTPSVSTNYTVVVVGPPNNCPGVFVTNVVVSQPNVQIFGANSVCQGSSLVLNATGAASYSWNTGGTGSSILVSPTSNVCYTVFATTAAGCQTFATKCITVTPSPVVSVSGNNVLCAGASATLTAAGASTYLWSNNSSGASIVVSPLSTTCYSVIGNSAGCSGMASICVTVNPAANILISPASATVCKGSSATFTATGGVTYTWSNAANTATLNVLPSQTSSYSVSATDMNGCVGFNAITVSVDTTCSNVWPGDANSDGVVNSSDVFELGLAYLSTGAARSGASNSYVSQYATNWSGTVSSGKNKCHADCNGDGTVNNSDTLAIYNNFSMTHAFRSAASAAEIADVMLVSQNANEVAPGQWNKLDIVVGDETNLIGMYGLAFDINFDKDFIENNSAYIVYTPSFLNSSNQQVEFRKTSFAAGKVYAASVRTDGQDVSGNGKIGEYHFLVRTDAEENTIMNASVSNASLIKNDRSKATLSSNALELVVKANPVGLAKNSRNETFRMYPNPANEYVVIESEGKQITNYKVTDITGRVIRKGSFADALTLSTAEIQNGTYFIALESDGIRRVEKLLIQR